MTDKIKTDLEKLKHELHGDPVPNLPPALGLCDACACRTPVRTALHLVLYCQHNRAGGFFDESTGCWSIVSPVEIKEFAFALGVTAAFIIQAAQAEAPPAGERH